MRKYIQGYIALTAFLIGVIFANSALAFSFGSIFNIFHPAQKPKPHVYRVNKDQKEPTHVKVGVYLLHVGKYDPMSASTAMDFYLIFKCKPVCNQMNFEVMNATQTNMHLVDKTADSVIYRVQADLTKADNLRNYPFDNHALDIIIEDRQMTTDKMVFEADPATTALDNDLNVVGFTILPTWTAKVTSHFYSVFQREFSSYKFSVFIKRPLLAGILKGVLPALIIMCCSFLTLVMKIEHTSQRLGIATSTLIASEVFHLNLTASLPPLGYVTFADMFMFINYMFLFVILIEVVTTTYFLDSKHRSLAAETNAVCAWVIPIIWLVFQAINWLIFNPTSLGHSSGS